MVASARGSIPILTSSRQADLPIYAPTPREGGVSGGIESHVVLVETSGAGSREIKLTEGCSVKIFGNLYFLLKNRKISGVLFKYAGMKQYSATEAAKILGTHDSRVCRRIKAMIEDGYPRPQKFGRSWMLSEADLAELKKRKRERGRPRKDKL